MIKSSFTKSPRTTPGTHSPSKKSRFFATSRGMSSAKLGQRQTTRFFSTSAGPNGSPNGCVCIRDFNSPNAAHQKIPREVFNQRTWAPQREKMAPLTISKMGRHRGGFRDQKTGDRIKAHGARRERGLRSNGVLRFDSFCGPFGSPCVPFGFRPRNENQNVDR